MIVMLQTQGRKTLDDLRASLAGSRGVEIPTPGLEAAYAFIAQTRKRFGYGRLGKGEKGLVRAYLAQGDRAVASPTPRVRSGASRTGRR
jgi:hypothetical protein